jgi:TolA-binding protein
MSTSSTTVDRKAMKQPDEFTTTISRFFDDLAKNSRAVLAVLGVLLAIGVAGTLYANKRETMSDEARNALFEARDSLSKELTAYASTLPPLPAEPSPAASAKGRTAKAEKPAAPTPRTADSVRFEKLDVDAKLAESVKRLQTVANQYSGTRAGFEAEMTLAGLYADHGEGGKAVPWFEKAVSSAPSGNEKALALYGLGYSQEIAGKPADAVATFEKTLKQGDSGLKGEILLAIARNQELARNNAQAKATYDQILSQLPNTEYARTAEVLRGQLQ